MYQSLYTVQDDIVTVTVFKTTEKMFTNNFAALTQFVI